MKECSKSIGRRLADSRFVRKYFKGAGLDIGGAPDPLTLYSELFPLVETIRTWDWPDGDAQYLQGVADETYDFVFSSHCLEHLVDPFEGLRNWIRVTKEGGHLIVAVPDEDLYEQGVFPSTFNRDHKHTFTICKASSWSDKSINLFDLIKGVSGDVSVEKIELLNEAYRYDLPRYDQTLSPVAESGIEFVLRKRPQQEIAAGGLRRFGPQPSAEMRIHLNQYKDDQRTMKTSNLQGAPFKNDADI